MSLGGEFYALNGGADRLVMIDKYDRGHPRDP
jgi:hypothetical protein